METFESIALRHSARGMDILSEALGPGYITKAAEALLSEEKGTVLIATGFYVGGAAETDGPPGAWCVAKTLGALGFSPVIVTDALCSGIFEGSGIPAVYADMDLGDTAAQVHREPVELRHAQLHARTHDIGLRRRPERADRHAAGLHRADDL